MTASATRAVTADTDSDFERYHLSRASIEPWEDGARTDDSAGTYEWWYFDAHLHNGAKCVVVFMNKDLAAAGRPLSPLLRINLELPDGRKVDRIVRYKAAQWSTSQDHADVHLGDNAFSGDLHTYRITAAAEGVAVDFTLVGTVPPWRPATGVMLFGAERDKEFAWLPSVPEGEVSGSYTVDGVATQVTGVGYHDHNWGNVALPSVVHDWYWARGKAGPFSVIASYITATEKYGYSTIPVFMLARDGEVIADDASRVRFERSEPYTDAHTRKPVAGTTRYVYDDGTDRYLVTFARERDLESARMVDELTGVKRLAARIARFDGAYLRFAGTLTVTHERAGAPAETFADDALWELMYFGHPRAA
jgi:CrtC N-terminal lipocalin domain